MTLDAKFKKLGNAIKRYRGSRRGIDGPWVAAPDRSARADVVRWLDEIGIPATAIATIDGFQSFDAYRAWMDEQHKAQAALIEARRYA